MHATRSFGFARSVGLAAKWIMNMYLYVRLDTEMLYISIVCVFACAYRTRVYIMLSRETYDVILSCLELFVRLCVFFFLCLCFEFCFSSGWKSFFINLLSAALSHTLSVMN